MEGIVNGQVKCKFILKYFTIEICSEIFSEVS